MSATLEVLHAEILRLPKADRARLLDRLVVSLDADEALEAEWDAVADVREAELDSGTQSAADLDATLARLQARFPG